MVDQREANSDSERGMMGTAWFRNWPEYCSLMGCTNPKLQPHHHHFFHGHLNTYACKCSDSGEPGTRAKEK